VPSEAIIFINSPSSALIAICYHASHDGVSVKMTHLIACHQDTAKDRLRMRFTIPVHHRSKERRSSIISW